MSSLGWAGFCAVAVSHGCRKPCQGQAKGVGGSSLIKAESRVLSSLKERGLKELRPWEGSTHPKSAEGRSLDVVLSGNAVFGCCDVAASRVT